MVERDDIRVAGSETRRHQIEMCAPGRPSRVPGDTLRGSGRRVQAVRGCEQTEERRLL